MRVRRLREAGAFVTLIVVRSLKEREALAGKGQILLNPVYVGGVDGSRPPQGAAALWIFGLEQVAFASAGAQHFAAGGDLKPLGHRFLCLDAFLTSHKSESNRLSS